MAKMDSTSGQQDITPPVLSTEESEPLDSKGTDEKLLSTYRPGEKPIDKGNWTAGQQGQQPQPLERSVPDGQRSTITGEIMGPHLCKHEAKPDNCSICKDLPRKCIHGDEGGCDLCNERNCTLTVKYD